MDSAEGTNLDREKEEGEGGGHSLAAAGSLLQAYEWCQSGTQSLVRSALGPVSLSRRVSPAFQIWK
jgi:hypothetical protein